MNSIRRGFRAWLLAGLMSICPAVAWAAIDATGIWSFVISSPYGPLLCSGAPVVQNGGTITIQGPCGGGTINVAGTIDPVSGVFSVSGNSLPYCGSLFSIAGTVASDGQSGSGSYSCTGSMGSFSGPISGTRTGGLPPTPTPTPSATPTPTPTNTTEPTPSEGCSVFTLSLPPAGGTVLGSTMVGSDDFAGDCGGTGSPEAVYEWVPDTSGTFRLHTCGSETNFDTILYVRESSCSDVQQELACNDDAGWCDATQSGVDVDVIAGQTYYVIVDGYDGAQGDFALTVEAIEPPVNDECGAAIDIAELPYATSLDATGATSAIDDPASSCTLNASVWYSYQATRDLTLRISTAASSYDTQVGAFTGACGSLSEQGCDEDGGPDLSSVLLQPVVAGETYLIEVTAWQPVAGALELQVVENCAQDADCDDGNPCTDDSCDLALGCSHIDNSAPCEDGNACTTGDTCTAGACVGGAPPNCDDGNVCTDDACDPGSGCGHVANTAPCDDGSACTTGDTCAAGACVGGAPPNCDDGNVCTDDSCDPGSGCGHAANTASCDDGSACTTADTCAAGSCVGGTPPVCDDRNLCTADSCEPATGCVSAPLVPGCGDDAYVGYKIGVPKKDIAGAPIPGNVFPKGWIVQLNDTVIPDSEIDDPEAFESNKPKRMLVAARVGDDPAPNLPELAYVAYPVKPGTESVLAEVPGVGFVTPPRHVPRVWRLDTMLGTVNVRSKKMSSLLVPTYLDLSGSPATPPDATHYACYQVSATTDVTEQTPDGSLRQDMQGFFAEELFGDCATIAGGTAPSFAGMAVEGMCLFDLRKPVELCNPVDKTQLAPPRQTIAVIDESVAVSNGSLLCYQTKLATKVTSADAAMLMGASVGDALPTKQAKHVPNKLKNGQPVYATVGNQFPGPVLVDTSKQDVVCVPASVTDFDPAP